MRTRFGQGIGVASAAADAAREADARREADVLAFIDEMHAPSARREPDPRNVMVRRVRMRHGYPDGPVYAGRSFRREWNRALAAWRGMGNME